MPEPVTQLNPRTFTPLQCNEIRRSVFVESLEKAQKLIARSDFGDPDKWEAQTAVLNSLAAIAEACGNDMVSDDDDEYESP